MGIPLIQGHLIIFCAVKYPDFDDAVHLCLQIVKKNSKKNGRSIAFSGKSDMKSAFRNLPLSKLDFMLTVMKAVNPEDGRTYYFVDKCLPFGASISCALFQDFSDCVAFIFKKKTGKNTVNYLDDYYFVAMLKKLCDGQIQAFLDICAFINFPVSLEKTVWGSPVIIFLGFLIDAENQVISIPVEKINRALDLIVSFLTRKSKKCTLHELQKLCGFLNHLCKCVVPGRAFIRRFYAFTAGKLLPHHHININREIIDDLKVWSSFLSKPAVYSRPFVDFSRVSTTKEPFWYTDASKNSRLGFGGIFNNNWFCHRWNDEDDGDFIKDENPCIEFLELYAVTVSVYLWIHKVSNSAICLFCDNNSVVKMIRKKSSSCKKCMILIRKITLLSLQCNVKISAKHVSTKNNSISDTLSRFQMHRFRRELRCHKLQVNLQQDQLPVDIWPVRKV